MGTRRETAAERVSAAPPSWRDALPSGLRPYAEAAPIAAFLLGVSSGFPYTMIGATLTTRLAQHGIEKSTVTAFTLGFLAYNLKFLWAWIVDGVLELLVVEVSDATSVEVRESTSAPPPGIQAHSP